MPVLGMIYTFILHRSPKRLTPPNVGRCPISRPTWPRRGRCQRCLRWTAIPLTRAPLFDWRAHLPGFILLRGSSELHRTSLKSFWPFRSPHLDSAEVSFAQEEHRLRVPDQQKPRELFILTFENIYLELFILFGLVRNRLWLTWLRGYLTYEI